MAHDAIAHEHADVSTDTLAERAALLIERDILNGRVGPGSRLNIQSLAATYGIGTTPIREALARLAARQSVVAIGQRGFRVPEISRADLEDITRVRTVIEVAALRRSMALGDDAWEAAIVAALHRLRRHTEQATHFGESDGASDEVHRSFHTALISGCASRRMLELHASLYNQAYRYRRVMMVRYGEPGDFIQLHVTLADAVLARRADEACKLLSEHLDLTIAYVYGTGRV